MKYPFYIFLIAFFLCACKTPNKNSESKLETIVCTTGMIGDAVENIVGTNVKVITLMGPGVDPHLYKATQGDLKNLSGADIIIYNGLHLEGKMGEIFEKLSNRKNIIVAAEGINSSELINNTEFQGANDPHLWFDPNLWSKAIEHISKEVIKLQPNDSLKAIFQNKTTSYLAQLETLHENNLSIIEQLNTEKRILITAHDAFGYFGKAYNFEVRGLQGISTTSEYGLKDVSDLVNYIVENKIKAVFVESSVSEKSINAVVEGCKEKDHQVQIGGQLYSDAMGEKGTKEGTYIGMVEHNVETIVNGLK